MYVLAASSVVLDHTADVQLHAWSDGSMEECLEAAIMGMYNYMTDTARIESEGGTAGVAEIEYDPGLSPPETLLFLMEECLFRFHSYPFVVATAVRIHGTALQVRGTSYDPRVHPRGTEVKAVTRSNLRVQRADGAWHAYVVLDI